jgi:Fic family protein
MKETMKVNGEEECKFLKESNAIEQVYDEDSFLQALYAWQYLKKQKKLSVGVILKTHKILMLNRPILGCYKGYFRDCQVWIGGREGCPHYAIKELINNWIANANKDKTEEDIKKSHIWYENIHPFVDGNGRTGRLFMNWQRIKNNLPVLVIKDSEKYEYYKWFRS